MPHYLMGSLKHSLEHGLSDWEVTREEVLESNGPFLFHFFKDD